MKKLTALLIAGIMLISFAACSGNDDSNETSSSADTSAEETTTSNGPAKVTGNVADAYVEAFKEIAADSSLSALQIASKFSEKIDNPMGPDASEMEKDAYFQGFQQGYEVKGFEEAATFRPMIGTIPFLSYVFKLSADADATAFATELKENANTSWNICTTADELRVEVAGNAVFMIMCPSAFEYDAPDGGADDFVDDLV